MKRLCFAETTLFEDDVVCYNIVCSIVKKVKRILLTNRKQNFGFRHKDLAASQVFLMVDVI